MSPKYAARRAMTLTLSFDVAVAAIALIGASICIWITQDVRGSFPLRSIAVSLPLFMSAAVAGFFLTGIHKQVWRHMGLPDVFSVLQAVGLSTLIYLPAMLVLGTVLYRPWATLTVALILWLAALFGGRMVAIARSTSTPFQIFNSVNSDAQPTLLVGNIEACADVLRNLRLSPVKANVRILGLVEVGGANPGRAIHGVTVLGALDDLGDVIEVLKLRYGQAPWLAMTGEARSRATVEKILDEASRHGAEVMALGGDQDALALEPVRPADLLARPERQLDPKPVTQIIYDSRVLVTGGGGTIGSELTRQVAEMGPEHISVIDASEFNLYTIDMELAQTHKGLSRLSKLGDVRDTQRVDDIFRETRPDVVIHAAALKHVPLMEQNFCEAVLTNVAGAINVTRAALASGTKHFVFISTDKAVDPDNVMGATKRLAEIAISRLVEGSDMSVSMVRFGNVLGSSGSVVPLFEKQILAGGPVTVTHADVTRYFMTVEEASSLVLQAAALHPSEASAGLYVLDMGEPILIRQLAETMIRMKGKVPDQDIMIKTTGLRPGEKMHEALTYANEGVMQTSVSGVMRVSGKTARGKMFDKQLLALLEAARLRNRGETLRLLTLLVPEYAKRLDQYQARDTA